ncbi:uncharacterized protein LOC143567346 [Bidens hawaiensis]|uniref:uncharacterized protein LOC143567346 n=1 Tax=Bidens hawaiensis TaxID=980011 RepID=UPI004049076A
MWDVIKSRNMGAERVKDDRLHMLIREFDSLMMKETETIDEYASRITKISSKAATLGQPYKERKLVQKFFTSLPSRFIQVVASLEQVLDLKTVGFEDVVGRLKAYEERIKGHVLRSEEGKLLFNNFESSSSSKQFSRESSRGRRKGSNRGLCNGSGDGRGNQNRGSQGGSNEGDKRKGKMGYSEVQCFCCDEFGHFVSRCPERWKERQAHLADVKEKDPSLYMVQCVQEKVYFNEQKVIPKDYEGGSNEQDFWYLDNGASNHITGSILVVGKKGKQQLLTDIYYIPSLQSNIISLGKATEIGCDIRMKDDYLLMYDDQGKLLMRVTRSKNRLYKIKLKTGKPVCLQARIDNENWLWHARLGHLNFESMKQIVTIIWSLECQKLIKKIKFVTRA